MDPEPQTPRVTASLLRRAEVMCRRRLKHEHSGDKRSANPAANARFAVSNRLSADARLAQTELGPPRAEAFVEPRDLEPEQQALYRAAVQGYLAEFGDRSGRAVDLGWHTHIAEAVDLVGDPGIALELPDGRRELRVLSFGTRARGSLLDDVNRRVALVRTAEWAPEQLTIVAADLIDCEVTRDSPDLQRERTDAIEWITERSALVKELAADGRARAGSDCSGCPFIAGCDQFRGPGVKRKLLADIVSITPSNFDDFLQCERRFLNRQLLGLPASDAAPPNDTGLLVHDLLRFIHAEGSCADAADVAEVLAGHNADDDHVRQLVDRHASKCPQRDVSSDAHEVSLARFHRLPPPMFMATARIDAIWVHDGLLDARDYKTGRLREERLAEDPSAKVQAFVLEQAARDRSLRLHLRYEYLNPDVLDDPDPWEPDADDLAAIEEEIRAAVEHMRTIDDWKGVADDRCTRCAYRSICRDSAARSVPTWPVLVTSSGEA